LAVGSIIGNTFVSEAAANTVGWEPPDVLDALVDAVDVCVAVLGWLLPQPTISEQIAIAAAAVAVSRSRGDWPNPVPP
jgi:hypothetical protein